MFIRKRVVDGTTYYAIVENFREHGRLRQHTVVSLGQCETIDEAIEDCRFWLAENRKYSSGSKYGMWATIGISRRLLFEYSGGGGLTTRIVGKEAKLRAEKLEAKLAVLLRCRDVMLKRG